MSALPEVKRAPRRRAKASARRRINADARVPVHHLVAPGYLKATAEAKAGTRVADFLEEQCWATPNGNRWNFTLPSILTINGRPVLQREWRRRRIKEGDEVIFLSRPMGGRRGGKSVLGIVAAIGLAVFAPWAGGALATGVLGLTAGTTAATIVGGLISAAIGIGGSLLISSLITPKAGGQNSQATGKVDQLYSLSVQGNTAKPLEVIPVQYGYQKFLPEYAAAPWSEYISNTQYTNVLLSRGLGKYEVHQVLVDDTILWDSDIGVSPSFSGVTIEHYDPGEDVDLFPTNVATAEEVNGQTLPGPSEWIGGFIINAAGTEVTSIAIDLAFPGGLFSVNQEDGSLLSTSVTVQAEYRPVDDVGAPISPFDTLFSQAFTAQTRTPLVRSVKTDVTAGRYEVRVRRTSNPLSGTDGQDSVVWAAARAYIKGAPKSFPVSTTAIRIPANEFTQNAIRRFSVIQTRILPVWDGAQWIEQATRNPWWAFHDAATNEDYGPRRPLSKIDFQTIVANAAIDEANGKKFDYRFDSPVTVPEAFDTILKPVRCRHRWAGDLLTAVRDEYKAIPRLLLTDREIVRGSLEIDFQLNAEDEADCVIIEYLDSNTWRPAEVQYPPNSGGFTGTKPARIRIDGIIDRGNAFEEAAFFYLQSFWRRTRITLETERDGRLLGFGSTVAVQSELPQQWGATGEVLGRQGLVLTLDRDLEWAESGNHYIAIRTRTGKRFGPVLCTKFGDHDNAVLLNSADLADVESQNATSPDPSLKTLDDALYRADGAEPPSFEFGLEDKLAVNCLVVSGQPNGDRVKLSLIVNNENAYPSDLGSAPALPQPNTPQDPIVPQITSLFANFRQGIAEPILDVTWLPAIGAQFYRADISYDSGTTWERVYEGREPGFSLVVQHQGLRVRVQGVGLRNGPFTAVDVEAPIITIAAGTVGSDSFKAEPKALLERVKQLSGDLFSMKRDLDTLANAVVSQGTSLQEFVGRSYQALGTRYNENKAAAESAMQVAVTAESALAAIFQGVFASTEAGEAEALLKMAALSDTELQGALAAIEVALRAGRGGTFAEAAFRLAAILDPVLGNITRFDLKVNQAFMDLGNGVIIPMHSLRRHDEAKDVPVVAGTPNTITVDLSTRHDNYYTLLTDNAEYQFPLNPFVGSWRHTFQQPPGGGKVLTVDDDFYILNINGFDPPLTTSNALTVYEFGIARLFPQPAAYWRKIQEGLTATMASVISITPAVEGRTVWNFQIHGPLVLGPGTYTIVPLGDDVTLNITLWGAGGSSGGAAYGGNQGSHWQHPGVSTGTAFTGPGLSLTAGAGTRSLTAPSNYVFTAGGAGGVASGGDININGNPGGNARDLGSVLTSGEGGNSADAAGGAGRLISWGSFGTVHGLPGGTPGAGASGGINKGNETSNLVVAAGGGGAGAKVIATRTLTEDAVYTITVGAAGAAGWGNSPTPVHGAVGGNGRAVLSV